MRCPLFLKVWGEFGQKYSAVKDADLGALTFQVKNANIYDIFSNLNHPYNEHINHCRANSQK